MSMAKVEEKEILKALHDLEQERWPQVLNFISYLKYRRTREPESATKPRTAEDLLQSELVGLWADRDDIVDSLGFARQLRRQAEHRHRNNDATSYAR